MMLLSPLVDLLFRKLVSNVNITHKAAPLSVCDLVTTRILQSEQLNNISYLQELRCRIMMLLTLRRVLSYFSSSLFKA